MANRYKDSGIFGNTLVASILYMITSGCTASTQYGYAEMLKRSTDGEIDFVSDTSEYARRANKMKKIFTDNGFHIVYNYDVTQTVGDGFFFTIGYGDMDSGELLKELLYYGVSSIALNTTGSNQSGIRACTSRMRDELYEIMQERMKAFNMDHPKKYKMTTKKSDTMIWNSSKECMSREQMRELQGKRLNKLVNLVYHNVPSIEKNFRLLIYLMIFRQ